MPFPVAARGRGFRSSAPPAWTPANISGLRVWLRGNTLGLSNNAAISSWPDSGSEGNNATQGTGTSQPLYKTTEGPNSNPAVKFDGVNDFFSVVPAANFNQPKTLFFVAKFGADTDVVIFDGHGTVNSMDVERGGTTLTAYAGSALNATGQTPTSWHIYKVEWNGASSEWHTDGALVASGNVGASNSNGMHIGNNTTHDAGYWFDGWIASILLYDGIVDDTNSNLLYDYLNDSENYQIF